MRHALGEYALEGYESSYRSFSEPTAAAENQGLSDMMLQRAHTVATEIPNQLATGLRLPVPSSDAAATPEVPDELAAGLLLLASRDHTDVEIWPHDEAASTDKLPPSNDEDCQAVKVRPCAQNASEISTNLFTATLGAKPVLQRFLRTSNHQRFLRTSNHKLFAVYELGIGA